MKFPKAYIPWVQRQLQAGGSPDHIVATLSSDYGYSVHVARQLVEAATAGRHALAPAADFSRPDVARNAQGAALRMIPTLPGWNAQVIVELVAPHILVFRQFVPETVVDKVLKEVPAISAEKYLTTDRAKHDHLFQQVGPAQACLDAASAALNWPAERWGLPIVRDTIKGMEFELHYDGFNKELEDDARFLRFFDNNARIGTLLIYLESADLGGATWFANLGLRVNLNPGDAVFFSYSKDNLRHSGTLHGGDEVLEGKKRIMTLFCYERALNRAIVPPTMS